MKIQDIITNAYNSDAVEAKQNIYDAISERAMNFLAVQKQDIAIDLFGDVSDIGVNEATNQLDELSKGTLGSYIKKASSSNHPNSNSNLASRAAYALAKDSEEIAGEDADRKSFKRSKNIAKAVDKLTKEEFEFDQLDELSKGALGSYIKKAAGDISRTMNAHGKSNDFDTSVALSNRELKRRAGLGQAVNKLTKEEFEQLDEELSDRAHELVLHADNDSRLYHTSHVPIARNLERKFKKGTYDHEKAKKLWKYHADRAADSYAKEHEQPGTKGHHIFTVANRKEAADHFANAHKKEMELGNFQG